jgi:hypothetical protein
MMWYINGQTLQLQIFAVHIALFMIIHFLLCIEFISKCQNCYKCWQSNFKNNGIVPVFLLAYFPYFDKIIVGIRVHFPVWVCVRACVRLCVGERERERERLCMCITPINF